MTKESKISDGKWGPARGVGNIGILDNLSNIRTVGDFDLDIKVEVTNGPDVGKVVENTNVPNPSGWAPFPIGNLALFSHGLKPLKITANDGFFVHDEYFDGTSHNGVTNPIGR